MSTGGGGGGGGRRGGEGRGGGGDGEGRSYKAGYGAQRKPTSFIRDKEKKRKKTSPGGVRRLPWKVGRAAGRRSADALPAMFQ